MILLPALLTAAALLSTPAPKAKPAGQPGPLEYIAAATALTLQKELDSAQKAVDQGRAKYPGAHGFHLKQGDIHRARGKLAEAFYAYQWEMLRAGGYETGPAAAVEVARIVDGDARGDDVQEIQVVLLAMVKLGHDAKGALADLQKVEATRGDRFVLTLFEAEARVQAKDYKGAERLYRKLLQRDAYFVPTYVELAGVLRLTGKGTEAAALDEKAAAIDPHHPLLIPREAPLAPAAPP